jgi:hypothetical protein
MRRKVGRRKERRKEKKYIKIVRKVNLRKK